MQATEAEILPPSAKNKLRERIKDKGCRHYDGCYRKAKLSS
jgi:hypothetical protein